MLKRLKVWHLLAMCVRLKNSRDLQSPKWQLIGVNCWYPSILCSRPLPKLTDNWTYGAWRPRFTGCNRAGQKCLATWSLYGAVFVIIPAATEDPPFLPFLLFSFTSGTFLRDISI